MNFRLRVLFVLVGLLASNPAFANAGIPMLALSWPVQWLAFLPVVAGEAAVTTSRLGIPYRATLKPLAIANLWSTLVGVPLAWLAMLLVEGLGGAVLSTLPEHLADSQALRYVAFPFFAAWIGGSSPLEFKAAFLVLMAVFCWVSVLVELHVLRRYLPSVEPFVLKRCVVQANIASYAVLTAVTLITFELTS